MAEWRTLTWQIDGMTCDNCAGRIERALNKLPGTQEVQVSYSKNRLRLQYNPQQVTLAEIRECIEKLDYRISEQAAVGRLNLLLRPAGALIVLLALLLLLRQSGLGNVFMNFPLAQAGMSYGMLFMIGLLTSVHCLAMCGGINLSQCLPVRETAGRFDGLRPSALYNGGRVLSYTIVGALVGALGSVVSFSPAMQGLVQLLAGLFMIIMGLNMLNLFPALRRITPRLPRVLGGRVARLSNGKSPLIVGLLNGLMPCGPLQAMQLYALSTGSATRGALAMLLFSLGTVPLMFGLGAFSSLMSRKFRSRVLTVGAALVVLLGVSMLGNGLSLQGWALPTVSTSEQQVAQSPNGPQRQPIAAAPAEEDEEEADPLANVVIEDGVQLITTELNRYYFEPITVQAGIPVRWTIVADRENITGCNAGIYIAAFDMYTYFDVGENVIEFTPEEAGTIPYSCWMGMMRSSITVAEAREPQAGQNTPLEVVPQSGTETAAVPQWMLEGVSGGCI